MCGAGRWDVLGRVKKAAQTATAAAAAAAGRPDLAAKLAPARGSVHLIVLRPSIDQSSWFRGGGAQHTRNGKRVFLHAVNADFDLAAPQAPHGDAVGSISGSRPAYGDSDLDKLAMWINAMHADPDRQLHASSTFPPALQTDDEPGALEYVTGRCVCALGCSGQWEFWGNVAWGSRFAWCSSCCLWCRRDRHEPSASLPRPALGNLPAGCMRPPGQRLSS